MWSLSELNDSWARPRPSSTGVRRDVLLALALAVAGAVCIELLRATENGGSIDRRLLESHLWSLAITLPLALRRVLPITVMTVCAVVFYATGERIPLTAVSLVVQAAFFMAIYAAWAWSWHRVRLLVVSGLVVLGMFVWLAQLIARQPVEPGDRGIVSAGVAVAVLTVAVNILYFCGAIAWGQVSYRAAYRRRLLVEQTEELRREQERSAARAVAEDRLRIARDLHDAVAHHVTGIGVQAAAARHVLDRSPDQSRTALAAIEQSSRSAVAEMHQIVGLLRDEHDDGGRPGVESLHHLARAGDGLSVRFREVGEPFAVPGPVGTSLYRAAQEALTNVRRHSTAREAEMVLRYVETGSRAVEVEVLDDGADAGRPGHAGSAGGFGLQGVRERVAVHQGTAEIGPRPDGGFRVRVRLPVDGSGNGTGVGDGAGDGARDGAGR